MDEDRGGNPGAQAAARAPVSPGFIRPDAAAGAAPSPAGDGTQPSSGSGGWLDPYERPWSADLEANYDAILDELKRLLDRSVWLPWGTRHDRDYTVPFTLMSEAELLKFVSESPERVGSGDAPNWRLYGIYLKGKRIPRGAAACPRTAAVVSKIPGLVNAGFSCLEAGYHLKPHVGFDPTLYRTHLGLIIPPGDCALRVQEETRQWTAGQVLMFDDTQEHEAWNRTPEHRFVLIVDTQSGRPPRAQKSGAAARLFAY